MIFFKKYYRLFIVIMGLLFIFILLLLLFYSVTENRNLRYSNSSLKDEISDIETKYDELDDKYNILNTNNNENYDTEDELSNNCEIIKTYEIVEIINDYSQTDEEFFVVIYEYMGVDLEVISIDKKYLEIIEEGKNYEFSISGYKTEKFNIKNFDVNAIVFTNKYGMDQIQENCS